MLLPAGYGFCKFVFRLAGDPEEQIVTFGFNPTTGIEDPDALAADIKTAWTGTDHFWLPTAVSNTLTFVRIDVITQDDTNAYQGTASVNSAGSRGTQPPPSNCTLLVRKNTGLAGRKNRGRMYWPAGMMLASDIGANGQLDTSSVVPTLQTRLTESMSDMVTGAGITMVILHDSAGLPTPVTSCVVQSVIATQRRRMRP